MQFFVRQRDDGRGSPSPGSKNRTSNQHVNSVHRFGIFLKYESVYQRCMTRTCCKKPGCKTDRKRPSESLELIEASSSQSQITSLRPAILPFNGKFDHRFSVIEITDEYFRIIFIFIPSNPNAIFLRE